MQTTLNKIWLDEFHDDEKALRVDFSNDRHHRVVILPPHGTEQLVQALDELARNISHDPHLTANVEVTGAARLYRAASVWTAGLGHVDS